MMKHSVLKAGGLVSLIVVGATVGLVFLFQMQNAVVVDVLHQCGWNPIATADADPGGDNSGFMYFMAYPHTGTPETTYAVNLSNTSAFEYSDSLNAEMTGETPHSTLFDFVMKFRVNDTVGYNVSSSSWEISWVRANITCDFDFATDIPANTAMNIVEIYNDTNFAYYHAWIADTDGGAGAGFQITHNEKYNITSVFAEGWY